MVRLKVQSCISNKVLPDIRVSGTNLLEERSLIFGARVHTIFVCTAHTFLFLRSIGLYGSAGPRRNFFFYYANNAWIGQLKSVGPGSCETIDPEAITSFLTSLLVSGVPGRCPIKK